ncbi:SmtA SAM-dependent methyltransferases [Burkholderiales bacterium]
MTTKLQVHDFWNEASCGEDLYLTTNDKAGYSAQSAERYRLEPFILTFADFESAKDMKVLEIGVGLGADHQRFAEAEADLHGIDLTERAVEHTRQRLKLFGLSSHLAVGDAENLDFENETFDWVYSWGVLHHSPNTSLAIQELFRVLKRGGRAKVMMYHKWSIVGVMLWLRYALLAGKPWRSLRSVYAEHLESPGTKAYSIAEARQLFAEFTDVRISTPLGHGDLLESDVGQRHRGLALTLAKKLWPRWFIRHFLPGAGLGMMIEARKP